MKLVIWGLKTKKHTHRYIHLGFWCTAKKINLPVVWVDNDDANKNYIHEGDTVISVDVDSDKLPIKKNVNYILHNLRGSYTAEKINKNKIIHLEVYKSNSKYGNERITSATYWNSQERILYQPWGTPLLREEFLPPTEKYFENISFWIGSVWNNKLNQGNINEFNELKKILREYKILLLKTRVPEYLNCKLTRLSRLSPAVGGKWQADNGYLPCRMFKNISFGQFGLTNILEFQEIFNQDFIYSINIKQLITEGLDINKKQRAELINAQQEKIRDHTYKAKLDLMFKLF